MKVGLLIRGNLFSSCIKQENKYFIINEKNEKRCKGKPWFSIIMKYYETKFEEYIKSEEKIPLHPELDFNDFPVKIENLGNLLFYGPTGIGKYTQALRLIKRYSPSHLKYEKKMIIATEKLEYTYHISDIHYEIDMSLLGCNSKIIWHELISQIVDIINVKQERTGIILCKNFHMIHGELLNNFYSYIQQYNYPFSTIHIHFILLTEHISFIPNTILNCCHIIHIERPSIEQYQSIFQGDTKPFDTIQPEFIMNIKELHSLSLSDEIPTDNFNIICDAIIHEMENPHKIDYRKFRDCLYDILVYNLDVPECIWYIVYYFIKEGKINSSNTANILQKVFVFLKYFNNNYRPIYHLESIFFYLIIQLHSPSDSSC
jgi:DNA polymerase III delta prime subunit